MKIRNIASALALWTWFRGNDSNGPSLGNSFSAYNETLRSYSATQSTQAYYMGLDLLELEGALERNVEADHIIVLNHALETCQKKDIPTSGLASNFARLINEGISSNVLAMYSYAAFHFLDSDADITELTNNFIQLVQSNPTEEEWNIYNMLLTKHLNFHFGTLTKSYADFLKLKPGKKELDMFKNITEYSKVDYAGIRKPVHKTIDAYLQLLAEQPTENEWKIFEELVTYQKSINYYLDDLITYFARITALKPSDKELEVLREITDIPRKAKHEVHTAVNCFETIIKAKPNKDQLEAYKQAALYCQKFGWAESVLATNFAKIIEAKAIKEQLKVYLDTIKDHENNKFNILTFTSVFAIVVRANPTPEKLKQFVEDELFKPNENSSSSFALGYHDLIVTKPESKIWDRFRKLVEYHKEKKLPFGPFTKNYASLVSSNPSDEVWSLYDEIINEYMKTGLTLSLVTGSTAALAEGNPSKLILDVYKEATLFHLRLDDALFVNAVQGYCLKLMQENAHPTLLTNYIKAVKSGKLKTREDSKELMRHLTVHAAVTNLLRNTSETTRKASRGVIQELVQNDPLPYPQEDLEGNPHPDAIQAQSETESVFRRAFNVHHGFSSLTFDSKRNPIGDPWMLARFGNDVAVFTEFINAQDPMKFPGRGVYISRLIPEKIFVFNEDDWREHNDPYLRYKAAWPWAKDEFDDLSKAQFIFTRGFVAVSCPTNSKYVLENEYGEKVHYSYIVFNDHHENYGCNVAYLVPTSVLKNKLWGTTVPYEDYLGFSKEDTDINDIAFDPEDFAKNAKLIPANVLNLCWGSNIGGGLCNAYPPGSGPFHKWESKRKMRHETRDKYNHVHKSHITGHYQTSMTKKMDKLLEPLRQAHKQVFKVTNKYQNLLDLFKLTLAMWHKGHTIGEKVIPANVSDDYLFDNVDYNNVDEILEEGQIYDMSDNPRSNRMLIEAYKWHEGRKVGKNNKNDFPVLVIADTLDYWSIPKSPIYLDTYDLTLKIDGETIQLPRSSDGTGEIENDLWYNNVIPYIQSTAKDLRFYDRRDLNVAALK